MINITVITIIRIQDWTLCDKVPPGNVLLWWLQPDMATRIIERLEHMVSVLQHRCHVQKIGLWCEVGGWFSMFSIFIGIYSPEKNPGFPEWDEPRARRRSDSRLGNFVHSTAVGRLGISDGQGLGALGRSHWKLPKLPGSELFRGTSNGFGKWFCRINQEFWWIFWDFGGEAGYTVTGHLSRALPLIWTFSFIYQNLRT